MPFTSNRHAASAEALLTAGLPARVRETLLNLHEAIHELVVIPFDRLLPGLEARLAFAREAQGQHAGSYLGQAALLPQRQPQFIERFDRNIASELAALRVPASDDGTEADSSPAIPRFHELRILQDDEADQDAEVGTIAKRQEARAALPLQLLCQRFGVLAAAPAFDPARLPVGPRRLCELMLTAAEASGIDLPLRIALLHEFDRQVLAEYPGMAEAINDLLAQHRIMPGLTYVPLRPRPRVTPADGTPGDRQRPHTGWSSAPSTDADTEAFQLLQELLATRRTAADRFRGVGGDALARMRPELDTAEILDILSRADASIARQDLDAVRQWVLLQGRQLRGESVALAGHDTDAFELLGLLYRHLQREVHTTGPVPAMLDQLRLPLLRVALTEPAFFIRSRHPAREVLNTVAEAGARWQGQDEVDPQLLMQLQRIVEELARPDADPAAFAAAIQKIEVQLQGAAKRSELGERRNVEAARGKDKLAVARQHATSVIDEALAGLRLPVFHRNMLRHAWADVLTLGHLRHGRDSADWEGLVAATHELAQAGAGIQPAAAGLLADVENWLLTVGYHADDAGRIARILTATAHEEEDDAATRTELAIRLKARARLGEEAVVDTASLPPRTAAEEVEVDRLRALPPGTWLEVTSEAGSLRRRLSWLSQDTGNVLLVNSRGQRSAETSLDLLARDLAAGRARIVTVDDGRLVDRVWRAALQSLGGRNPGASGGSTT